MWKQYYNVTTVSQALMLLSEHREQARIIAGGTDILIELERKQRGGVDVLIDVSRVADLDTITDEGDYLRLGPLVTHNDVVADPLMRQFALPLALASWEVGAPQIRNRATIAGNLITASPANDTITPLLALKASVVLTSVEGNHEVPLSEFYTGLRQTVMKPHEMLTAIHVPKMRETARGVFLKLGLRRAQAISVVNAAVILDFDGDVITDAAVAFGSVAPTVIRLPEVEALLTGHTLDAGTITEAAHMAASIPKPIDDVRSTAQYRQEMIKVLIARALRQLNEIPQLLPWGEAPAMLWGDRTTEFNTPVSHDGSQPIEVIVNGKRVRCESGHDKTLLHFLRDDVGLVGTKEGCSEGECGSCTVLLDGCAVMACMVPAPRVHGATVTTVEGLRTNGQLHPIQQAFIDEGAVQCGYCTPGFLMAGAMLLEEHPHPTETQIRQSISGNLCRCTGYYKIVSAFQKASQQERD